MVLSKAISVQKDVLISKQVDELIMNFHRYLDYFEKNNPFSGPSDYFYTQKIITIKDYDLMFTKEYVEVVYATLASWGMHRMSAKMADFSTFSKCILGNKDLFLKLKPFKLKETDLDKISDDLDALYLSLGDLMKSKSKLVATTKVMHFFLPELIFPMDREYTMKFFKLTLPTSDHDKAKELEYFHYVLKKAQYISQNVNCKPKEVDNAIIGYVKYHKYT